MHRISLISKSRIAAAALFLVLFAACKKKDSTDSAYSHQLNQEVLGNLVPQNSSEVGFNYADQPLIRNNNFLYEWRSDKQWHKVGDTLPNSSTPFMVQHKQGDYYVTDGGILNKLDVATGKWIKVVLPDGNAWGVAILLANGNGDVLIRQSGVSGSAYGQNRYLRRAADAADWTVVYTVSADSEGYVPCYYANNGNVYYSYKAPIDNGVQVRFFNVNTGTYGLICDESDPVNSVLVNGGTMAGHIYFHQNGDIYGLGDAVYKLSGTNMPNKLVKVATFAKPVSHNYEWSVSIELFAIDAAENLKVLGSCSMMGAPVTHGFAASGSLKSGTFSSVQHPYTQSTLRYSLRGSVYIWPYLGTLSKWN